MPFSLGFWAAAGAGGETFEQIATTVVSGSSTTNVSFTGIPQFYRHLQLRITMRGSFSSSENLYMRFNNTTYSYSGHAVFGDSSNISSINYTSANFADMIAIPISTDTSNIFGGYVVDILDYASSSKNKTIKTLGGFARNTGSGIVQLRSNLVVTTDPITQIHQIGGSSGNALVAGTRVSLYGIRG